MMHAVFRMIWRKVQDWHFRNDHTQVPFVSKRKCVPCGERLDMCIGCKPS